MVRRAAVKTRRTNAEAVEAALAALGLGDEHAATVQLARSLAAVLDDQPHDAQTAREYRQVLEMLGRAGSDGGDDDTLVFQASLRTPGVRPPVRNRSKS